MAEQLSWLDDYFGPPIVQQDGTEVPSNGVRRRIINFVGATVEDDEENERLNISGGGAVPAGDDAEFQIKDGSNLAATTGLAFDTTSIGLGGSDPGKFFNFGTIAEGGILLGATSILQWSTGTSAVVVGGFDFDSLNLISALKIGFSAPIGGSPRRAYRQRSVVITKSDATDLTLSDTQNECPIVKVTGTPGGAYNVIGSNVNDQVVHFINDTASPATFMKSGGTGVTVAAHKSARLWHNGTDYERLTNDASPT